MNPALLALLGARVAAGGGGGSLSATYLGSVTNSLAVTAAALGTASADRTIILVVSRRGGESIFVSGVTIAGVAATVDLSPTWAGSNAPKVAIARAAVPVGTTGDIAVTFNVTPGPGDTTLGWFAVTGGTVALASATSTDTNSLAVTVPAGGLAIIGSEYGAPTTWTGFTPSYTGTHASTWRAFGGILPASGTVSNASTTIPHIAAASYVAA